MPNSSNCLDRGLAEWFGLSDVVNGGTDFNRLVLLVLRRLNDAFPDRADLSDFDELAENAGVFDRIWNWLEKQEIVNGPMSDCSLTLLGSQSYREALNRVPELASRFLQAEDGLSGRDAKKLVLVILRQHFYDYVERTKDQ